MPAAGSRPARSRSRWGWAVNVLGLIYGVTAIVMLSIKTPPYGDSFFDRWLVPISVGIVAAGRACSTC